jgi:NAD(P)-dependent dehydrogenase (short-subunit alcohol dehydrogenase family)
MTKGSTEKSLFITGGSAGIGLATAKSFFRQRRRRIRK